MLVAVTNTGGIMNADNGSYKEEVKNRCDWIQCCRTGTDCGEREEAKSPLGMAP